MRPCLCGCGGQTDAGWRPQCVAALLLDIRRLQNLPPGQIVILSDIFRQVGARKLADAMTGAVPFDEGEL